MCKKGGPRCDPGKPSRTRVQGAVADYFTANKTDKKTALLHASTVARSFLAAESHSAKAQEAVEAELNAIAARGGDNTDILVNLTMALRESEYTRDTEAEFMRVVSQYGAADPEHEECASQTGHCRRCNPLGSTRPALLSHEEFVAALPEGSGIAGVWERRAKELDRANFTAARQELADIGPEQLVAYQLTSDETVQHVTEAAAASDSPESAAAIQRKVKAYAREFGAPLSDSTSTLLAKVAKFTDQFGDDSLDSVAAAVAAAQSPGGSLFASALFRVPESKQTWHEPTVRLFISSRLREIPGIKQGVVDLRNGREGSLRFYKETGDLVAGAKRTKEMTKSVDFVVYEFDQSTQSVEVQLVSHKYTGQSGGSQGSTQDEAQQYLDSALKSSRVGTDIPMLREIVGKKIGVEIPPEKFTWRPALILDGKFNEGMEAELRKPSKEGVPGKDRGEAFIGPADDFVVYITTAPAQRPEAFGLVDPPRHGGLRLSN